MSTTPYHEATIDVDLDDLQFFRPIDRAEARPLSGEILFLANKRGASPLDTVVLGFRSASEDRYVVLNHPDQTSSRWKLLNVSRVPRVTDSVEPERPQPVLSERSSDSFHFTDLPAMSVDEFNRRYGHTHLSPLGGAA